MNCEIIPSFVVLKASTTNAFNGILNSVYTVALEPSSINFPFKEAITG
jgi:hypothetical protein